ncbi:MAG: hypothetical protein IKS82_01375 [Bacteroidales bacterium]|nr:hypothetical protein [Bacteroidales bacterium]
MQKKLIAAEIPFVTMEPAAAKKKRRSNHKLLTVLVFQSWIIRATSGNAINT